MILLTENILPGEKFILGYKNTTDLSLDYGMKESRT